MANLLWGKVYYKDLFAGFIREEPGDRVTFTYDSSYIEGGHPAIAHTLPVREEPHISNNGLHPFFDNLVSEGWLELAQSRLLGRREVSRFELLLAFGFDCAGAVSIVDPEPSGLSEAMLDVNDPKEMALLTSRASLSGVQPKLAVIEEDGLYRPARIDELSTHIAKFPSPGHPDLIENEYLTTLAYKALLPDDEIVELDIKSIDGLDELALLIKRFDRSTEGRVHFEEFNQLLGRRSRTKYEGAYRDMANFILETDGCLPTQAYLLYRRILAGLLLGNTDMHFKNFAMFHAEGGLRLTPTYDQVAASLYNYKTLALAVAGSRDHPIGNLNGRHLVLLGEEFGLSPAAINMAAEGMAKNTEAAKDAISEAPLGSDDFKDNLIKLMEKRWNGTFSLIGKALSRKQ
ncbi:MAG: HipA domain-containing protein [Rhodospirillales bacterium]|nr:HipA domain-containing protein [Rhodospirillales bacterium]